MTRESKNVTLARWLGWVFVPESCDDNGVLVAHWITPEGYSPWRKATGVPDFYTSEEASALLLEKMRRPLLVSDWPGCEGWRVDIGVEPLPYDKNYPRAGGGKPIGPTYADRKEAIAEACLAWISAEESK